MLKGSHKCDNGQSGYNKHDYTVCYNPFCMMWESQCDNMSRVGCHTGFFDALLVVDADTGPTCDCPGGLTIPCTLGREHQTREVSRQPFFEHFRAICYELDEINKRKKPLGRCPLPDCGYEVMQVMNNTMLVHLETLRKFVSSQLIKTCYHCFRRALEIFFRRDSCTGYLAKVFLCGL
jgi:hypothetical protein